MCVVDKLVSELEIKAPAHKFYSIFKDKCYSVPDISSKCIQKVEIHGGDWDCHCHGSIKSWYYTLDDKAEVFKERVEFDDEKLVIFMTGLEGDLFKYYKTFNASYRIVPKGSKRSLVVITLDYQKLDDNSPYPYKYIDIMNNITKDIESHLK